MKIQKGFTLLLVLGIILLGTLAAGAYYYVSSHSVSSKDSVSVNSQVVTNNTKTMTDVQKVTPDSLPSSGGVSSEVKAEIIVAMDKAIVLFKSNDASAIRKYELDGTTNPDAREFLESATDQEILSKSAPTVLEVVTTIKTHAGDSKTEWILKPDGSVQVVYQPTPQGGSQLYFVKVKGVWQIGIPK